MADLLARKETTKLNLESGQGGSLLFYLGLLLFFLASASYGGIILLNSNQHKTKERLIEEVKLKEENLRSELLAEIFLLDERLKNMGSLLRRHTFTSNIFKLLETDIHPAVRFTSFNLAADSRKIDMAGEAVSYTALAKQIGIFERNAQIERVEFGGLSFTVNNLIGFKLTIILRPGLLLLRP